MEWLCICFGILFIIVAIYHGTYRRQIREICRQLDFLQEKETNKRIQTDLYSKDIIGLANRINHMMDKQERESLSIRKKERQLKEALANIAHDIRTPLTSMRGFFELLTEETDTNQKERYAEIIENRMEDLSVLLEELFTYTKLQNEAYELALQQQDFTRLVLDSLFSFYEQWKEKGIHPKFSVEEGTAVVCCNDIAVKRILTNVLRNAMIHGDGQIEICYRVNKGEILFQCYNGLENTEELEVERVFERFYKGDAARRESSSGLGLSIAKELTKRMDGEMDARIENGRFLVEISFRCV